MVQYQHEGVSFKGLNLQNALIKEMLLVIDNYDSFTYNLVQYLGELGETVEVRRNDEVTLAEIESMAPARVVISPGPGTPDDAGISLELIKHFSGRIPIL